MLGVDYNTVHIRSAYNKFPISSWYPQGEWNVLFFFMSAKWLAYYCYHSSSWLFQTDYIPLTYYLEYKEWLYTSYLFTWQMQNYLSSWCLSWAPAEHSEGSVAPSSVSGEASAPHWHHWGTGHQRNLRPDKAYPFPIHTWTPQGNITIQQYK